MASELAAQLRTTLLNHRNGDGGWGYYPGKRSRLEATCWAGLALLSGRPGDNPQLGTELVRLLQRWRTPRGLLAEPGLPVNLAANGLASLLLGGLVGFEDPGGEGALVRGLLATRGTRAAQTSNLRQDNSLRAWPWSEDTFSWVEPTAWCLLALKRARRSAPAPFADDVVREAEALLFDRRCPASGWNYGNSNVLGQELHPYVPTTALALLALQDRREHVGVREGTGYLMRSWPNERSGMALALTTICLQVLGLPTEGLEAAIEKAWLRSEFLSNLSVVGMACFALGMEPHGKTVFQL